MLSPVVCEGALGVGSADVPLWQQALGTLVLTHEAFISATGASGGARGRWSARLSCTSGTPRKDSGRRSHRPRTPYPYALALHDYKVGLFPQYRDPKCVIPPWAPPTTTG